MEQGETSRVQININVALPADEVPRFAERLAGDLSTDPPQDAPCEGGVWRVWNTTTTCVDHVVHFIDTVVWLCPDGHFETVTSDTVTDPPVPC